MVSKVCALPVFEQLLGEIYRRRHALNSVSLARPLAAGPTLAEPQLCSTVPSELSNVCFTSVHLLCTQTLLFTRILICNVWEIGIVL